MLAIEDAPWVGKLGRLGELRGLGDRQVHLEGRPALFPADLANESSMPLDDAANHAQAKAGTAAARREERREDRVLEALRNAATVVGDAQSSVRARLKLREQLLRDVHWSGQRDR